MKYEIGHLAAILAPFGDGETLYPVQDVQAVKSNGEITEDDSEAECFQYQVNESFYAEQYLRFE